MKTRYNPERRTWRGRSYRRGGRRIRELRIRAWLASEKGT